MSLAFFLILLSLELVANDQDQLFISFALGPNSNSEELSTTKEAGSTLVKNKMYYSIFYSSQKKIEFMADNDKPNDSRYEIGLSTGLAFSRKRTAKTIVTIGGGINYYSQLIYKPTSKYMLYESKRTDGIGVQLKLAVLKKLYKYLGVIIQTSVSMDSKKTITSAQFGFCFGNFNKKVKEKEIDNF